MERGYSTHSRYLMNNTLEKDDKPVVQQIKKAYWTARQHVIKTMGKRQDEHIVAADAELDAKLELFKQIKSSCDTLRRVIVIYNKRLVVLAREENAMGKFLRNHGEEDMTRAGSMMCAVGKSQGFNAQQRIQMRTPLYRLYQEVETFHQRAVADTMLTVEKMENARTEYRGALMWMKDVSESLDPDAYNRLEKFRKVQGEVRKAKELFDKRKLDVLQKVDMLAASRSNMYSTVLANYQNALLSFWKKTSRTMNAVSETFKGFQYYEFNMLKDLDEATRELADQTSSEKANELVQSLLAETGTQPKTEEDKLIYEIIMSLQDKRNKPSDTPSSSKQKKKENQEESSNKTQTPRDRHDSVDSTSGLIDFYEEDLESDAQFGDFQAAMGQSDDMGDLFSISPASAVPEGLGTGKFKDDKYSALANEDLLDDIFGSQSDSSQPLAAISPSIIKNSGPDIEDGGFLPADLLDTADISALLLQGQDEMVASKLAAMKTQETAKPASELKSEQTAHPSDKPMSSWYDLFADLDPLQDPDSVGKPRSASGGDAGCA